MKRAGGLWPEITSFANLLHAARQAQQGKRYRSNVLAFNARIELELEQLQRELLEKTYRPGAYRTFEIYEPKRRMISAAPYRDRVVHHALCHVIAPIFERTFIHDSYANRAGFGTHRALRRFTGFLRSTRYVLQCDIRKYFPSIDHICAAVRGTTIRIIADALIVTGTIQTTGTPISGFVWLWCRALFIIRTGGRDVAGRIIEESRPAPASVATRSEYYATAGVLVGASRRPACVFLFIAGRHGVSAAASVPAGTPANSPPIYRRETWHPPIHPPINGRAIRERPYGTRHSA